MSKIEPDYETAERNGRPVLKGTRIFTGVPRSATLDDLLPPNGLVQSAVIRIDVKDAVRVSCEYIVKTPDETPKI